VEPITTAVAAFGALKAGISAGKEVTSLAKEIGALWNSIDEITHTHNKKKNSIFKTVEEEALSTFMDKKKAEDMENQLREIILYTRGHGAWQELIKLRSDIRKQRQADKLKRQKERQKMIELIAITGLLIVGSAALIGFAIFLYGAKHAIKQ